VRIVVDTNVVISGTFFGGPPRRIIESIVSKEFEAYATPEIIDEYQEIVEEMIRRKQGHLRKDILSFFTAKVEIIEPMTKVSICRDSDDDKFISCAIDAKALYIISGDKDLLEIEKYEGVEIITAADFCLRYL